MQQPPPQSAPPLAVFGDFGFVAGEDVAPNPIQNRQVCINFYPEVNKQNPKEVLALLGCPGLLQVAADPAGGAPAFSGTEWAQPSAITNLPVRGFLEIPGANLAFVVIGYTLYSMKQTPGAGVSMSYGGGSLTWPSLTLTAIGSLATNSGVVVMAANNGVGYGVSGTVVGTVAIVDGPNGYWYNWLSGSFSRITDPGFLGADRVDCIDGWFIFNQPGTQAFYTPIAAYGQTFGSFYALKDGAPDNLVTHIASKEMLWLLGELSTEVWYNAGGPNFPFQRLAGSLMQTGCKAKHSVSVFNSNGQDGVIWYGRSKRGENVIIKTVGLTAITISSPAFGAEVAKYPKVDDAIGYVYQEDTHDFYVLTFPSADVTWVYDGQSDLLHKRLSFDPYHITPETNPFIPPGFHRHRSNCFMNFAGMRLVGDYQCGAIYWMTRQVFTDAGWPLLAKRRSPHIWDKDQRGRTFMASLQIDFVPGVGNATGLGSDPQCTISISKDAGRTYGQRWPAKMGALGQGLVRTMWRKLGFARDSVVDLEVIDPVCRDIAGATLRAFSNAIG